MNTKNKFNIGFYLVIISAILVMVASQAAADDEVSLNLPTNEVTVKLWYYDTPVNPNPVSYWTTSVTGIPGNPGEYDVNNSPPSPRYVGWCVDENHTLNDNYYGGSQYQMRMYSSYDEDRPPYTKMGNHNMGVLAWNKINFIINNKNLCGSAANRNQIQNAIWYYEDGGVMPNPGTCGRTLVDAAEADEVSNGPFIPGNNQLVAVILDPGLAAANDCTQPSCEGLDSSAYDDCIKYCLKKQLTIIEVPVPGGGNVAPEPITAIAAITALVPAFAYGLVRRQKNKAKV